MNPLYASVTLIFVLLGCIPLSYAIKNGKVTTTNASSWIMWSVLVLIACAKDFGSREYSMFLLSIFCFLASVAYAHLWRPWKWKLRETCSLILTALSTSLWLISSDPSQATQASLAFSTALVFAGLPLWFDLKEKHDPEYFGQFIYLLGACAMGILMTAPEFPTLNQSIVVGVCAIFTLGIVLILETPQKRLW